MPDSEIATAFGEQIAQSVVHISVRLDGDDAVRCGTGTIFACVENPRYGNGAFILTAKHVVEVPPDRKATYSVSRLGPGRATRLASFQYLRTTDGGGPRSFWYTGKEGLDIGALIAPGTCEDGASFLSDDEHDPPRGIIVGVPLLSGRLFLSEGTRVAWAGYPRVAQELLGKPTLCYYEGVVAHALNDGKYPLYLLDGHNDHGVSGGPVWCWNDEHRRIELVGIVTHYCQASLSGFVIATAVNPFRMMFDKVWMRGQ